MSPSRRTVLAAAGASAATLAGCTSSPGTDVPENPPSSPDGSGDDRQTATPRDPEPLDAAGAWPQRGADPGHTGATDAIGVPDDARTYWHLRRVRSGPAVLADGRLVHYAKLGEDRSGRPTLTRTREEPAGTAHPVHGVPHLVARDASDGRVEWATRLPGRGVGWPTVSGGRVVATSRGRVAAHDAADGTERWAHEFGDHPVGGPTVAGDAAVVPFDGTVDGATGETVHEPAVRAFGLADGHERWSVDPPARAVSVAVAGDAAVVLAHDFDGNGAVQARSLADGRERWRVDLAGTFRFEGPVVAGGRVYVAGSGGELRSLALVDGTEDWRAGGAGDGFAATPDAVYTVDGGELAARDAADGSVRWSFAVDEGSFAAPAVGGVPATGGGSSDSSAGGTVYVGGSYADLHALGAADGTVRWRRSFPDTVVEGDVVRSGVEAQPTVADGAVYAFAADGLYAFGPP